MIRIIFNGIGGRIGRTMYKQLLKNPDFKIVAGVDKLYSGNDFDCPVYSNVFEVNENADVIIDFSVPEALEELVEYAVLHNVKLVAATTGHTPKQIETLREAAKKIAVFKASNMSLGVSILTTLAKETAGFLGSDYDIEIVEQHHNRKVDSPSGTALTLAEAVSSARCDCNEFVYGRHDSNCRRKPSEIGIHAVRGGSVVGKHDVMYFGSGEVITLSHESQSIEVFVQGSLRAASFIMERENGLFNMDSIIGSVYAVTNVTVENDITLITVPSIIADNFVAILDNLGSKNVNLDMISQTMNYDDSVAVSFTLSDADNEVAFNELYAMKTQYIAKEHTAKITSEGAGMAHSCGVAKDVLKILREAGADIYSITTSETKISCCIDEASVDKAKSRLQEYYRI